MNAFSEFSDFLIEVQFRDEPDYLNYRKLFINDDVDEELNIFINDKINNLDEGLLKLALILKKYDILDKTKKNRYLKDVQEDILKIFFSAYHEEEYIYSINIFLTNFKPLREKDFIIDYYLENHENINNPFGLIDSNFAKDAKFKQEKLNKLIDLALIKIPSISTKKDLINMENTFDFCEKLQIQDRKMEVAKRLVDYFLLCAKQQETVQRNFLIQHAFKYINFYGENKIKKKKELFNLVLDNTYNIKIYFDKSKHLQEFEIENAEYNKTLAYFKKIGTNKALYEISQYLFNLYDYESEKRLEKNIMHSIATTIAYDNSGLPIYIVDSNNHDDIFFHEKSWHIQIVAFLYSKYIRFIRENTDFTTYIKEFYLPENLRFIKDLGILNDFKDYNFYGFISQMIPIIENHFRYCLSLVNEPYITTNEIGGYDYLPMKAFLESDVIKSKLGINTIYILKLIFDDRRGLNYRNKLAHGILNPTSVTEIEANLVFLTLIFMSYFEQKLLI